MITDTLVCWEKNDIAGFRSVSCDLSSYKVDSLLCFNSQGNKLITCILEQNCDQDFGDGIHFFYGVKINRDWYFFRGSYVYLPRELYQKKVHTPLSYVKLHEIAISNIYRGYLIKDKNGKWEINDDFFSGIANKNQSASGYGSCFECQTEEEYYLYLVKRNWEKKK